MPQINAYLSFNGNCEEAFEFYKSVFGGEFIHLKRFSEMPPMPGMEMDEAQANKVMNVALPISGRNILFGSDANPRMGTVPFGKNISLSLDPDSREQATTLFNGLAEGGKVSFPLADMFWGAYFGMLEDKFGVNWMVNYTNAG